MIDTQAVMRSLPLVASVIGKKADIQGSEVYKEFLRLRACGNRSVLI